MTTEETFSEIYRRGLWGNGSGTGSDEQVSGTYCDLVVRFARERGIQRVVDVGCGDFRVGRRIADSGIEYIGIDVVPDVIERNRSLFGRAGLSFLCLNAIVEKPPPASLCLIRQVLQHLSNAEIASVLDNCCHYADIVVTEHLSVGYVVPNKDKPHGPDTRVSDQSGVYLDLPPFSLRTELLLEVPYNNREVLRTVLIHGLK